MSCSMTQPSSQAKFVPYACVRNEVDLIPLACEDRTQHGASVESRNIMIKSWSQYGNTCS